MKKYLLFIILGLLIVGSITAYLILKNPKEETKTLSLTELTGSQFKAKINAKDSFILVIYKDGCSHCENYMPIFESVMNEYNIAAFKINTATLTTDDLGYLQSFITIEGTPTTTFFENGEEASSLNRINGEVNKIKIISRLQTMGYIEK